MIYCKYLKLLNGENIIVTTDNDCANLPSATEIEVVDPVLVTSVRVARGNNIYETFMMQPWIKPAKKDLIRIPVSSIVVAVSLDDDIEQQYMQFVSDLNKKVIINTINDLLGRDDENYDDDVNYNSEDMDEIYGTDTNQRTIH